MTERERYRETTQPLPRPEQVYERTTVEETDTPAPARRDLYVERRAGPAGEQYVRSEHVREPSHEAQRASLAARVQQIVYFVVGVIDALLAIRFVLLLLGANQGNGFVQFVYGVTQPFVAPFLGIFGEPAFGGSVLEWASIVAIIVYALLGYFIARLVALALAPARPIPTE